MITMRKTVALSLALTLVLGALPALAQTGAARARDLQRLQYDLQNLDESLQTLDPNDRRAAEFQRRADEIAEEVTCLKVTMRRAQTENPEGTGVSYSEVERIRRDIVALQNDIDDVTPTAGSTAAGSRATSMELPVGTEIEVTLDAPISSRTARPEDRIEASVARPVRVEDTVLIPAGAQVRGVVTRVQRAERPARSGEIQLAFNTLMVDGTRHDIRTRVVEVDEDLDAGDTARRGGIGAILGGVLGGVIGGKKGAIIGVLLGGGGAIAASKGEDVELPAGTVLSLRIDEPVTVTRK
jgi:hypothetical protein